jgi:hypothetical protein
MSSDEPPESCRTSNPRTRRRMTHRQSMQRIGPRPWRASMTTCAHSSGTTRFLWRTSSEKTKMSQSTTQSIRYPTVQDAMIARAKHYTVAADGTRTPDPVYVNNREKVYEIIAKMMRDHSCWTYVKPAQKTRRRTDGLLRIIPSFPGPHECR